MTGWLAFASAFGIGGKDTAVGVGVGAGLVVAAGVALGAGVVVAAGAVVAAAAQVHEHVTQWHRAVLRLQGLLRLQGQRMLAAEGDWHSLLPGEQLRLLCPLELFRGGYASTQHPHLLAQP